MYLAAGTFKDVRDGPWHILTDYTVNHLPYCNQEGGGERGLCSALFILKLVLTYIPAALRMSMMAYLAFSLLLNISNFFAWFEHFHSHTQFLLHVTTHNLFLRT